MSAPELVVGYVVAGKYVIRSTLFHGGATATYRATAPKNRDVALKLYDPAILTFPAVLKTLAQHRSVGAALSPNQIVPIAETGTDSNSGAPFTVTDFESAPSLGQLIDRGPLSASNMATLIRNLAHVTDLLHSNGIASLSLHPFNVFVRPAGYEVRVADFGGSLIRTAIPAPDKARRWMPWLAPEQIKGQPPPTETADIFSLALIAFFAVTGKPYWRSSQMKTPDTAALRREILGERMPASVRASEFSITLNPAVDSVFARALAFRPTDRYSTAREFAMGLEAALSGRPVAEADAARPATASVASSTVKAGTPAANVASSTVKADVAGTAANRAPSSADLAPDAQRMAAPAPRKMPLRSTMLGMGNAAAAVAAGASGTAAGASGTAAGASGTAAGASGTAAGARPPLKTMMGMGEPEGPPAASAKATAPATAMTPAKATAPATAPAPVRATAQAMPAAAMPAGATRMGPPPMPVGPAMSAQPPIVESPSTTARRAGPPPLPETPPPAQVKEVLRTSEAGPPAELPRMALAPTSTAASDVAQTPPAWSPAQHRDSGAERIVTGVAVIGADRADLADRADAPKKSRLGWVASACGLLVLTGGVAWALSGGSKSSSRDRVASDAKGTAAARMTAAEAKPISVELPATEQPPAPSPVEPEARTGAALEPPAPAPPPAPPPAAIQEPAVEEPAVPVANTNVAAPPAGATARSAPSPTLAPQNAPQAQHAQPSKKPCGKFLKRCK